MFTVFMEIVFLVQHDIWCVSCIWAHIVFIYVFFYIVFLIHNDVFPVFGVADILTILR